MATIFGHIFGGPGWWWKDSIFLAVFGVPLIGWIWDRRRAARFKVRALPGTARVLSLEPTSRSSDSSHVCKIGLWVEIAGREPYGVTIRQDIHVVHLARVQPGAAVPVQVDSADPQKVLIDFNQLITPPHA
jgi:hypothetical protein